MALSRCTGHDLLEHSRVLCLAPWVHQHVSVSGKVHLCCDAYDLTVGDVTAGESLASAWNSGAMRQARLDMLRGRQLVNCHNCYAQERLGNESYRQYFNSRFAHRLEALAETGEDGSLDETSVRFLDVRLSNLCNLRCRICSAAFSTRWYPESVTLGLVPPDRPLRPFAVDDAWFLAQAGHLLPHLEQLHFAGGEPLLIEAHYRLLDALLERGLVDVQLNYNTNFTRLALGSRDVLALWRHFRHVRVEASLDGSGARGDYMRKGQEWIRIVANRERLMRECPHVEFLILATVSNMNVLHLPDFYRDWVAVGYLEPDAIKVSPLRHPRYLNIQGLPPEVKQRAGERYQALIERDLPRMAGPTRAAEARFAALIRFMWSEQFDAVPEFWYRMRQLDGLRHEKFADVFPEMAELLAARDVRDWDVKDVLFVWAALGDVRRASADLGRILARRAGQPDEPQDLVLAMCRLAAADFSGAFVCVTRALGWTDIARGHLAKRCRKQLREGALADALDAMTALIRLQPGPSADLMSQCIDSANVPAALAVALRVMLPDGGALFTEPAFAHYARAVARQELGSVRAARRDFAHALTIAQSTVLAQACRTGLDRCVDPQGVATDPRAVSADL
jgi:MoaA/NifB/PqqE/SkfB family radical SAM enzyme